MNKVTASQSHGAPQLFAELVVCGNQIRQAYKYKLWKVSGTVIAALSIFANLTTLLLAPSIGLAAFQQNQHPTGSDTPDSDAQKFEWNNSEAFASFVELTPLLRK